MIDLTVKFYNFPGFEKYIPRADVELEARVRAFAMTVWSDFDGRWTDEDFDSAFKNQMLIVAFDADAAIVGYMFADWAAVEAARFEKRLVWVTDLAVADGLRGCGVGRRLMDEVVASVRSYVDGVGLDCRPSVEGFYLKCGFVRWDVLMFPFDYRVMVKFW